MLRNNKLTICTQRENRCDVEPVQCFMGEQGKKWSTAIIRNFLEEKIS